MQWRIDTWWGYAPRFKAPNTFLAYEKASRFLLIKCSSLSSDSIWHSVVTDSKSQYCSSQYCTTVSHFVHYWLRTLTQSYCTEKYHSRGWKDMPQRLTSPSPCSPHSVFVTMMNTSAAASPATAAAAAASTMPAATSGPLVRPSRCTITQGTTHCTCEPGYTISGRDSNTCTGTSQPVPDTDMNTHI